MKLYDISLTLSAQSIRWVTAQPLELIERKRMRRGDTNNSSSVHTSVHAGTHVDAPFHFVPDGITIESLPLKRRTPDRRVWNTWLCLKSLKPSAKGAEYKSQGRARSASPLVTNNIRSKA